MSQLARTSALWAQNLSDIQIFRIVFPDYMCTLRPLTRLGLNDSDHPFTSRQDLLMASISYLTFSVNIIYWLITIMELCSGPRSTDPQEPCRRIENNASSSRAVWTVNLVNLRPPHVTVRHQVTKVSPVPKRAGLSCGSASSFQMVGVSPMH
jgi:hypothetical protein